MKPARSPLPKKVAIAEMMTTAAAAAVAADELLHYAVVAHVVCARKQDGNRHARNDSTSAYQMQERAINATGAIALLSEQERKAV